MEHVLTVEEVQELETQTLNEVEIELHYFLFLESQKRQPEAAF